MLVLHTLILAHILCIIQTPAPLISFEKKHHDFGRLLDDQKVSYKYKVTNSGSAILQIKEARSSCDCSYAVIGQHSLKPDESTFIEVHFDPSGLTGNIHRSLEIISNDPANPNSRLTFVSNIIREIIPNNKVVFFNDVSRDGRLNSSIRLQSGNERPVIVTGVKIQEAPYLSCTFQNDGNDVILNIDFNGKLVPKKKQRGVDRLTVLTSSKTIPILQFPVQWNITGTILATPAKIIWNEAVGKELTKTVVLKNTRGRAFRILKASSSSEFIKVVNISKQSMAEQTFDVILSPNTKAGGYNEKLLLKLDTQEQQTVEINVVAVLR